MQKEVARMNSAGEQMSVRTKFMIETITDLKNNKMKAATKQRRNFQRAYHPDEKGTWITEQPHRPSSEPLRITRDDIKNSDQKGKWWLIGASWRGNDATIPSTESADQTHITSSLSISDSSTDVDLLALSRQYGMNITIRRAISSPSSRPSTTATHTSGCSNCA